MSATRDPSQKHTFVYSNLYQLYQKGKVAAQNAVVDVKEARETAERDQTRTGLATGKIIKAEEMATAAPVGLRVARHEPPRLLGKRIEANRPAKVDPARRQAIDGLRDNLRQLQGLHERLRFMLKEIEELTNE
ncbi:MAG: hypothetical protein JST04_04325 [Bdellovibrionales bacterium]|nr:hypothetical protein [Bdellovibrionales bacterium]